MPTALAKKKSSHLGLDLRVQTEAARSLLHTVREAIGEDEEAKLGTIEGETGLIEAIEATVDRLAEIEFLEAALAERMKALRERKDRLERSGDTIRLAIMKAMAAVELRSLELPEATLSVRASPPKVVITSEVDLPSEFLREPPPVPDKKAIMEALKAGTKIPGAELSNGGETLNVKRS